MYCLNIPNSSMEMLLQVKLLLFFTQVYSKGDLTCPETHYGKDCASECSARHCEGDSSCDPTGRCQEGCQERWTGADCSICTEDFYGQDCAKKCDDRFCRGNSSCESTTGQCEGGCQAGWTGVDCTELGPVFYVAAAFAATVVVVVCTVACWRKRSSPNVSVPESSNTTVYFNRNTASIKNP